MGIHREGIGSGQTPSGRRCAKHGISFLAGKQYREMEWERKGEWEKERELDFKRMFHAKPGSLEVMVVVTVITEMKAYMKRGRRKSLPSLYVPCT